MNPICLQHTELSVEHLGQSPSSLSGAPPTQIPESFEWSLVNVTQSQMQNVLVPMTVPVAAASSG